MNRAGAIGQYEELSRYLDIEIERGEKDGYKMTICKMRRELYSMAIAALREQEQSKWISVKERLPKDEWEKICKEQNAEIYPCLCYRRSSSHYDKWYVTKAYFDGEYFVDLDNIIIDEYITHWIPLPEPPEGGAEE